MAKANKQLRNCNNAIQRFIRNKNKFANFESFEAWYVNALDNNDNTADKEIEHLDAIKKHFDIEFRKRDYYLSSSALDEIIFHCIKNSTIQNFTIDVIAQIELHRLDQKSIVIFPIHNFGFQFLGIKNLINEAFVSLSFDDFQICTQTNSLKRTIETIELFCRKTIKKDFNKELLRHFYLSRNLKWLERNPLLIFSFHFSQLTPYENLVIILEKLSHITNQLYFLTVLRSENSEIGKLFSTKKMNNWETLDLKHFLTISGHNSNILCKPIHNKYDLLFNEMHLNIDILAKTKNVYKWEQDAINCLDKIYEGNKNYLLTKESKYLIHHKISNSLKYFRRSVKSVNLEDKIININIAIEALLLDNEGDKVAKIFERLDKSLKYYRNKKAVFIQLDIIIKERNNIVHNALITNADIDFITVYRMYCKVVSYLSDNIAEFDCSKSNKMSLFFKNK